MRRRSVAWPLLLMLWGGACAPSIAAGRPVAAPPLPSDARRWLGTPVSWTDLRGKVVLLDVWTFG